jgi:CheY-like chemotaxis protein
MLPGRRILLADDSELIQKAVKRLAGQHGYEIIEARTGADVKRIAIETQPEPIVLDVDVSSAKEIRTLINEMRAAVNTTIMTTETETKAVEEARNSSETLLQRLRRSPRWWRPTATLPRKSSSRRDSRPLASSRQIPPLNARSRLLDVT